MRNFVEIANSKLRGEGYAERKKNMYPGGGDGGGGADFAKDVHFVIVVRSR